MQKLTVLWPITEPQNLKAGLTSIAQAFSDTQIHLVGLFTPFHNPNPASYQAFYYGGYGVAPMVTSITKEWRDGLKNKATELKEVFEEFSLPLGSKAEWREDFGDAESSIAYQSLYADVIVLVEGSGEAKTKFVRPRDKALISRLLSYSPTPLLLLPALKNLKPVFSEPMVAWKATPEAAAATKFLANTLNNQTQVKLIHVINQVSDEPLEAAVPIDAATYLSRRGFVVEEEVIGHTKSKVGKAILGQAHIDQSSMVVMGAYSRAKWVEQMFGGVTEYMLAESDLPLLLAR